MDLSESFVSLLTLTLLEIVLGIDNVIFITILADKLPPRQAARLRKIGLIGALAGRLGLLFAIQWVMTLTNPLFSVMALEFSGKSLILLGGGLFLLGKATHEIYEKLEAPPNAPSASAGAKTFGLLLGQILLLDVVFSLDSVITAVGMAQQLWVMVTAMILAVGVMLLSAGKVGAFVSRHPSMQILALSFLILIGVMLMAEGFGQHVGKGYIYFAMAFSLGIELLNMRFRKKHDPLKLHAKASSQTPEASA